MDRDIEDEFFLDGAEYSEETIDELSNGKGEDEVE